MRLPNGAVAICDFCCEDHAQYRHQAPDGRWLYFCLTCRDRTPLTELIADVCQRAAPLHGQAPR
jgi:hypothetical protein